jgi:xylan 1,4-beta-xylosidase
MRPVPASRSRRLLAAAVILLPLCAFAAPARAQAPVPAPAPLIAGNHPDPTVMRAADGTFYASATSGGWAPIFPIFRSPDLVHWQQVGSIFPRAPRGTAGNYWAPELVQWSGRFLAFFSASRMQRKPCIGVAEAAQAEGPWTYRGHALCWPAGVIDPQPFSDADGSRWLLFKGLGSGGSIYAMRFDEQSLRAYGPATRLITPDVKWEQDVTEGPSLLLRQGTYYLFYSGGHCCAPPCTYAEGVARASSLLGPYVKDPENPILSGDSQWKCPGHGTVLDLGPQGTVFLHHAYVADDVRDLRREMLLDSVDWGADGWPDIDRGADAAPAPRAASAEAPPSTSFADGFDGAALAPGWEWPFDAPPAAQVGAGALTLSCAGPSLSTSFISRQVVGSRFSAVVSLATAGLKGPGTIGLAGYGPWSLFRGLELRRGRIRAVRLTDGGIVVGPWAPVPPGKQLRLLLSVIPDGTMGLYVSGDGVTYTPIPGGPATAGPLPTRIALTCRGHASGRFLAARLRVTG